MHQLLTHRCRSLSTTFNNLVFWAGLPRSGGTLLSSILSQNPNISTGRLSGLCDLMWDTKCNLERFEFESQQPFQNKHNVISSLPNLYYKEKQTPVVMDRCRSWTMPANIGMILEFVTDKPKIICSVRDYDSVRLSYEQLFLRNNRDDFSGSLYETEMNRNIYGVEYAKSLDSEMFLFVDYDELVDDTKAQLSKIDTFIGLDEFSYDLNCIENKHQESWSVDKLDGMHDVRETVSRRHL